MMQLPRKALYRGAYLLIKIMHLMLTERTYQNIRSIAHKNHWIASKIRYPNGLRNQGMPAFKLKSITGVDVNPLLYRVAHKGDLPSVSIIVVTLGQRKTLDIALQSVERSKFGMDLELVLVAPILSHVRIKKSLENLGISDYILIADKKEGIYQAMNIGILNSKNEYIIFLNDDDQIIENAVPKIFELSRNLPDLIACNSLYHYSCCNYYNITKPEKSLGEGILRGAMGTSHQSQIWKRKILIELGGFRSEINQRLRTEKKIEIKLASDFDLFVRAASKKISYGQIDMNMSISSPTGASLTLWRKTYIELLQIVWHEKKPGLNWLLKLPILVLAIEIYHRNSRWLHEH
jgi:glycosyltransferase involved in cell wall biosynthesis